MGNLWRIARNHGGDFTLWATADGHHAVGTLVDALRCCGPAPPRGFVPEPSITTLNRLRPDRNCAK
jgi:hypothetical protein